MLNAKTGALLATALTIAGAPAAQKVRVHNWSDCIDEDLSNVISERLIIVKF